MFVRTKCVIALKQSYISDAVCFMRFSTSPIFRRLFVLKNGINKLNPEGTGIYVCNSTKKFKHLHSSHPTTLISWRCLLNCRKVSKAYKGKNSPIIVMCASGCDQSGCYVLMDLVLNKIYRGAKEIDISATLEHLRDQRCGAVSTKVSKQKLSVTVSFISSAE